MSKVAALALRDLRSLVVSPVAWIVGGGYLLLAGYFFFNLVSQFGMLLRSYSLYAQIYQNPSLLDRVNLNDLVVGALFRNLLVLFLFMMPVLTMRSFAEERKLGTDELLLTSPVTPGQIVTGKLASILVLSWTLVASSLVFPAILLRYGDPEAAPILTGALGLALAVAALGSLGMAVSAATDSQVVAGVGSFVLYLVLFIVDWPADSVSERLGSFLRALSLPQHVDPFAKGLVTSPDVAYFLSLVALGWFASRALLASQRWR